MVKWKHKNKWRGVKENERDTWNRWDCTHTHTHTHTSQFLNNRNAIAVLYEGVFCVDAACAESVASGFGGVLFFADYTEIVRRLTETLLLIWVSYEAWIGGIVLVSLFGVRKYILLRLLFK